MAFREIRPTRSRSTSDVSDVVRVSFQSFKEKNQEGFRYSMILYIGKKIAELLGIQGSDKIRFYVDSENPRVWLVKKSDNQTGYKTLDLKRKSGKTSDALRVQLSWKEFIPTEEEMSLRTLKYETAENGITIDAR
jgi:bifunctional DNA-binding transcriptional regulator/antitoxin component of YhaV-PrlF toxin-antitoxin module